MCALDWQPLLDKDEPNLQRVVLSMVGRVNLEIAVLVFSDELKPVLERNVHVWSDSPLSGERGISRR